MILKKHGFWKTQSGRVPFLQFRVFATWMLSPMPFAMQAGQTFFCLTLPGKSESRTRIYQKASGKCFFHIGFFNKQSVVCVAATSRNSLFSANPPKKWTYTASSAWTLFGYKWHRGNAPRCTWFSPKIFPRPTYERDMGWAVAVKCLQQRVGGSVFYTLP